MKTEERLESLESELKNLKSKKKDYWDRADIIGKWLIPISIAGSTIYFNIAQKEKEAELKTFEVAIGVLQSSKSVETPGIKEWAIKTFQSITDVKLTIGAIDEIKEGKQLPSTNKGLLLSSNPNQLRIFIIRPSGISPSKSEELKSVLVSEDFENVVLLERPLNQFPKGSEVRFYYSEDKRSAESLNNYIKDVLKTPTEPIDKSKVPDARKHRLGDLHIYVK